MPNIKLKKVIDRIQKTYGGWDRETTLTQMRQDWDQLFAVEPVNAELEDVDIDGLPCRWISSKGSNKDRAVLYFHGGGFRMGSIDSHQDLMLRISAAAGCRVLGVNYRLGSEHQYPAALDDAKSAYQWLLDQGIAPSKLAVMGDSAGGNLAASLLNLLSQENAPMPAAAVYLSPWFDMNASTESYQTRAEYDPIHQRKFILALASSYLGEQGDPNSPLTSPIMGDLTGMPPTLIQVGDCEVGLDESHQYADKARLAEVEVELEVWDGMIHVFQQFAQELPEAREAIDKIGKFLRQRLGT